MKVLITGAGGFVGKNLVLRLREICSGHDSVHTSLYIDEVMEWTRATPENIWHEYCGRADFVFHLAGVNRPEDSGDYERENVGFTATLLNALKSAANPPPVMLASSIHAAENGGGAYGASKRRAERLTEEYGRETGAQVMIYRLCNLFGKWSRPEYNSVVATFCQRISRGLPIRVDDSEKKLELLYIDDLMEELLRALEGRPSRDQAGYCYAPGSVYRTLGEIAALLTAFSRQPETLMLPDMPEGSFEKKLYATYLSYLPMARAACPLVVHRDSRGCFTELLKNRRCGQVSVNRAEPGVTRGQHYHNSKWEIFVVLSGLGMIRQRKLGEEAITEIAVSGENPTAVYMLPGYTHELTNLSSTEPLLTLIWASEIFDPQRPDTYWQEVAL